MRDRAAYLKLHVTRDDNPGASYVVRGIPWRRPWPWPWEAPDPAAASTSSTVHPRIIVGPNPRNRMHGLEVDHDVKKRARQLTSRRLCACARMHAVGGLARPAHARAAISTLARVAISMQGATALCLHRPDLTEPARSCTSSACRCHMRIPRAHAPAAARAGPVDGRRSRAQ